MCGPKGYVSELSERERVSVIDVIHPKHQLDIKKNVAQQCILFKETNGNIAFVGCKFNINSRLKPLYKFTEYN